MPLVLCPVGDSISWHCLDPQPWDPATGVGGYCAELGSILTQGGIDYVFSTAGSGSTPGSAVAGVATAYWATHIHDVLVANNPDVVILHIGTNDNQTGGTGPFETSWKSIVDQIHAYRPASPVKVVGVFVQYSNPEVSTALNRTWLTTSQPATNDAIWRNRAKVDMLVDLQCIPADDLGLYTIGYPDGIHPTALGCRRMAQLIYRGIRATMGWPDIVPQPCGMSGHRHTELATYLPLVSITPCSDTL